MLILLRHGQTTANAGGLLQGHMDLPLDATGIEQARLCGEYLRNQYPGAVVVSSPLLRAQQTAEAIGAAVVINENFIELDYGQWDGVAMSEVDQAQWSQWRNDPTFRPPGGESLIELDERVRPALVELCEIALTSHVIIVSHVSPIKSAITWALNVGPEATWRCHLDRASVTRIQVGPRGPALAGFNDVSHLL
jgi:broad specificity phosphatase PhoE